MWDIVCFEALAELTLAILQKDRLKDPSRGYTFDIGIIASKILPEAYKTQNSIDKQTVADSILRVLLNWFMKPRENQV